MSVISIWVMMNVAEVTGECDQYLSDGECSGGDR